MVIAFIILAIAAGLLPRRRLALLVTAVLWVIALVLVGWGPAHSKAVHTDTLRFWVPWLVVLVIGEAATAVTHYLRSHRRPSPYR